MRTKRPNDLLFKKIRIQNITYGPERGTASQYDNNNDPFRVSNAVLLYQPQPETQISDTIEQYSILGAGTSYFRIDYSVVDGGDIAK